MSNQMNPEDQYIWSLATIIEKLADVTYNKDREAFSEVAGWIDGVPGQIMRGIASFAWMAVNFPRDVGGEAERMRDAMQLVGILAEAVDALTAIETKQGTLELIAAEKAERSRK